MSAPIAAKTSRLSVYSFGMRMVVGATSRTSSLSPRKSCMADSAAASASLEKPSAKRFDCFFLPSADGCSLANRHLPSAPSVEKGLP